MNLHYYVSKHKRRTIMENTLNYATFSRVKKVGDDINISKSVTTVVHVMWPSVHLHNQPPPLVQACITEHTWPTRAGFACAPTVWLREWWNGWHPCLIIHCGCPATAIYTTLCVTSLPLPFTLLVASTHNHSSFACTTTTPPARQFWRPPMSCHQPVSEL